MDRELSHKWLMSTKGSIDIRRAELETHPLHHRSQYTCDWPACLKAGTLSGCSRGSKRKSSIWQNQHVPTLLPDLFDRYPGRSSSPCQPFHVLLGHRSSLPVASGNSPQKVSDPMPHPTCQPRVTLAGALCGVGLKGAQRKPPVSRLDVEKNTKAVCRLAFGTCAVKQWCIGLRAWEGVRMLHVPKL